MTAPILKLFAFFVVLFAVLIGWTSRWTVFEAKTLQRKPENKRTILSEEGADPDELETLARAGVRYFGSDTTHIYCLPTCHDARRVTERHLVRFSSAGAASAAGYRPCKHCRPTVAL